MREQEVIAQALVVLDAFKKRYGDKKQWAHFFQRYLEKKKTPLSCPEFEDPTLFTTYLQVYQQLKMLDVLPTSYAAVLHQRCSKIEQDYVRCLVEIGSILHFAFMTAVVHNRITLSKAILQAVTKDENTFLDLFTSSHSKYSELNGIFHFERTEILKDIITHDCAHVLSTNPKTLYALGSSIKTGKIELALLFFYLLSPALRKEFLERENFAHAFTLMVGYGSEHFENFYKLSSFDLSKFLYYDRSVFRRIWSSPTLSLATKKQAILWASGKLLETYQMRRVWIEQEKFLLSFARQCSLKEFKELLRLAGEEVKKEIAISLYINDFPSLEPEKVSVIYELFPEMWKEFQTIPLKYISSSNAQLSVLNYLLSRLLTPLSYQGIEAYPNAFHSLFCLYLETEQFDKCKELLEYAIAHNKNSFPKLFLRNDSVNLINIAKQLGEKEQWECFRLLYEQEKTRQPENFSKANRRMLLISFLTSIVYTEGNLFRIKEFTAALKQDSTAEQWENIVKEQLEFALANSHAATYFWWEKISENKRIQVLETINHYIKQNSFSRFAALYIAHKDFILSTSPLHGRIAELTLQYGEEEITRKLVTILPEIFSSQFYWKHLMQVLMRATWFWKLGQEAMLANNMQISVTLHNCRILTFSYSKKNETQVETTVNETPPPTRYKPIQLILTPDMFWNGNLIFLERCWQFLKDADARKSLLKKAKGIFFQRYIIDRYMPQNFSTALLEWIGEKIYEKKFQTDCSEESRNRIYHKLFKLCKQFKHNLYNTEIQGAPLAVQSPLWACIDHLSLFVRNFFCHAEVRFQLRQKQWAEEDICTGQDMMVRLAPWQQLTAKNCLYSNGQKLPRELMVKIMTMHLGYKGEHAEAMMETVYTLRRNIKTPELSYGQQIKEKESIPFLRR